jgi:hypothetical protein
MAPDNPVADVSRCPLRGSPASQLSSIANLRAGRRVSSQGKADAKKSKIYGKVGKKIVQ